MIFRKKLTFLVAVTALNCGLAFANETTGEKVKNETKQGWTNTKQTARDAKAEIVCKTNDKKCLEEKAKAKAKNARDEAGQTIDEVKDKVD